MENYVHLELKRMGYYVKIGRLSNDTEIDFIAEKGNIIKYFQVCYLLNGEETIKREYAPLEKINDNWEKYIVSFDDISLGISKGIQHISVLELERYL